MQQLPNGHPNQLHGFPMCKTKKYIYAIQKKKKRRKTIILHDIEIYDPMYDLHPLINPSKTLLVQGLHIILIALQ